LSWLRAERLSVAQGRGGCGDHHPMAERPAKLARLQHLRARLPFISQSALGSLLNAAEKEPLPTGCNRNTVREARNNIGLQRTPYGTLHQTIRVASIDGGFIDLEIQHPMAMLWHSCTVSESLSKLVQRTAAVHASSPERPWKLALYMDEILPGNQLGYTSARKMWCLYWTILDWGSAAVADEDLASAAPSLHQMYFGRSSPSLQHLPTYI
jgi:hypothetical protein